MIGPGSQAYSSFEVIDPSGDPPVPCQTPEDYPFEVSGSAGAFMDGTLLICGGYSPTLGSMDLCFKVTIEKGFQLEEKSLLILKLLDLC